MEDFIRLKKDNIFRVGILDADGNDTGEHIEFDMEDVELPLRINECDAMHRKNVEYVKMQFAIIEKKEDKKGKFILSSREEEKIKILNEFYKREMKALDLFLGDGGTNKMLNGRKPYLSMYDDINEMLKPILPKLKIKTEDIINTIKSKYAPQSVANDEDVLK